MRPGLARPAATRNASLTSVNWAVGSMRSTAFSSKLRLLVNPCSTLARSDVAMTMAESLLAASWMSFIAFSRATSKRLGLLSLACMLAE